ncbi:MAG: redox-sensing transcriptional repressor Rex [Candidatus Omnitrophica bacterium]|nr:redox-sensing transcriptional repressor Rex [Candidatus Omnitrophota bacterium]
MAVPQKITGINKNSIPRLVQYKYVLKKVLTSGSERVYSNELADAIGITSAQVRKDFSLFGITGNKRGGYSVPDLLNIIQRILGSHPGQDVIIAGMGHLGIALSNYKGFETEGIHIKAGFDIDPGKCGTGGNIPVYPFSECERYISSRDIKVGILAVPADAAQRVLDVMIRGGIEGVLNFAPVHLMSYRPCVIHDVNLMVELEFLLYFVNVLNNRGGIA